MDQAVFHFINQQWTSPALDLFLAGLSDLEIWRPLLVALGLYALIFGGFKGRAFVVCLGLTLMVAETFVVKPLKTSIDRRRPKQSQTVRMVHLQPAAPKFLTLFKRPTVRSSDESERTKSGPSFPSGHVTDNFIAATFCAIFFRRWGWLYFIVAALMGYSRIYLGAHWPSDVLASAFMGAGVALLMTALLEFLWRGLAKRWAPEMFARHPRLIGNALRQVENLPHE